MAEKKLTQAEEIAILKEKLLGIKRTNLLLSYLGSYKLLGLLKIKHDLILNCKNIKNNLNSRIPFKFNGIQN